VAYNMAYGAEMHTIPRGVELAYSIALFCGAALLTMPTAHMDAHLTFPLPWPILPFLTYRD
jgi:hypothetical protein